MPVTLGIDVGGTFTDFLCADDAGATLTHKVPTTPTDPARAVLAGLADLARMRTVAPEHFLREVEVIVHGTTVTTNAVLTGHTVPTGLLTTRGFRDILQMRRGIRESRYNNKCAPPPPLVPRRWRRPVTERMTSTGAVQTPLDEEDLRAAVLALSRADVFAVAICFMHAYANPAHERRAAAVVRTLLPEAYVTLSSDILPQVRFYDRVSTTVMNCAVGPILARYLASLTRALADGGFGGVLLVMQSNGGVTTPDVAMAAAVTTLLSGPAAGPVAGAAYAERHGFSDAITMDMGGTSFDTALVVRGRAQVRTDGVVNRYLVGLPMMAIHTIGAGGGSIAWIDAGGLLRVGPQSAGADPGPACYGLGGTAPTVTDADLVLGYLDPDYFLGGRMRLDPDRARRAIAEHIAAPLGLDVTEAALGIYRLVTVAMAQGIRQITVERGVDPRDFPLMVAGGGGPVHAGMIATELEISTLIIPRESSVFCAAGMLMSDLTHDFVRTCYSPLRAESFDRYRVHWRAMEQEGRALLCKERVSDERMEFLGTADMRYVRQYHDISIPLTRKEVEEGARDAIAARFHETHHRLYGYALPETAIEVLNVRLRAVGRTARTTVGSTAPGGVPPAAARRGERPVVLPTTGEHRPIPIYDGDRLGVAGEIAGPAIVEQATTTIVVPPGYVLTPDARGTFLLTRAPAGGGA